MNMRAGDTRFVLLCPAWKKFGSIRTVKPGTVVLHSRARRCRSFGDSEELIQSNNLPRQALIEVGSDHRLADPESLQMMLRCCERLTRA